MDLRCAGGCAHGGDASSAAHRGPPAPPLPAGLSGPLGRPAHCCWALLRWLPQNRPGLGRPCGGGAGRAAALHAAQAPLYSSSGQHQRHRACGSDRTARRGDGRAGKDGTVRRRLARHLGRIQLVTSAATAHAEADCHPCIGCHPCIACSTLCCRAQAQQVPPAGRSAAARRRPLAPSPRRAPRKCGIAAAGGPA